MSVGVCVCVCERERKRWRGSMHVCYMQTLLGWMNERGICTTVIIGKDVVTESHCFVC